ncbi:MAG: hypothetical protein HYS06_10020 [Methylocystis sp.]|nr:hypothetical protein [Methylocystis sp.]MBI3274967.1 hypothetical protein [Methylocystis sp.]
MILRHALAAVLAVLALSGCAVPIDTQWKLKSYKLESANLASLRVAVRAPAWLVPTPDTGKAIVTFWNEGEENAKRVVTIRLQRANHAEDAAPLAQLAGPEPIAVFEVDRRDLGAARAAQEDARRRREETPGKTHGMVTLEGVGCRKGDIPPGPIPLDVVVHTDDSIGWLPLVEAYDVRPDAAHEKEFAEQFAEHVPLCGKAANRVEPLQAGQ